jgi:hypothetical protein
VRIDDLDLARKAEADGPLPRDHAQGLKALVEQERVQRGHGATIAA